MAYANKIYSDGPARWIDARRYLPLRPDLSLHVSYVSTFLMKQNKCKELKYVLLTQPSFLVLDTRLEFSNSFSVPDAHAVYQSIIL